MTSPYVFVRTGGQVHIKLATDPNGQCVACMPAAAYDIVRAELLAEVAAAVERNSSQPAVQVGNPVATT